MSLKSIQDFILQQTRAHNPQTLKLLEQDVINHTKEEKELLDWIEAIKNQFAETANSHNRSREWSEYLEKQLEDVGAEVEKQEKEVLQERARNVTLQTEVDNLKQYLAKAELQGENATHANKDLLGQVATLKTEAEDVAKVLHNAEEAFNTMSAKCDRLEEDKNMWHSRYSSLLISHNTEKNAQARGRKSNSEDSEESDAAPAAPKKKVYPWDLPEGAPKQKKNREKVEATKSDTATKPTSSKLPDPPIFDGQYQFDASARSKRSLAMDFEDWDTKIYHKLRANGDHYPDEETKISYVYSRLKDAAAKTVQARVSPMAVNPFPSVNALLKQLRTTYSPPGMVERKQNQFHMLKQDYTPFVEFHPVFEELAAHVAQDDMAKMNALKRMLNRRLRQAVAGKKFATCEELSDHCQELEYGWEEADIAGEDTSARVTGRKRQFQQQTGPQQQTARRNPIMPDGRRRFDPARKPLATTPSQEHNSKPRPARNQKDFSQLDCYNCKKKGHIMKNCPEPRNDANINAVIDLDPDYDGGYEDFHDSGADLYDEYSSGEQ